MDGSGFSPPGGLSGPAHGMDIRPAGVPAATVVLPRIPGGSYTINRCCRLGSVHEEEDYG